MPIQAADLPEPGPNSQRGQRRRPSHPWHSSLKPDRLPAWAPIAESQRPHAALTVSRNLPTSSLRRLLSRDSDCAADSTCEDAEPVSPAPRCTSTMLEDTIWVP